MTRIPTLWPFSGKYSRAFCTGSFTFNMSQSVTHLPILPFMPPRHTKTVITSVVSPYLYFVGVVFRYWLRLQGRLRVGASNRAVVKPILDSSDFRNLSSQSNRG